MLQPDMEQAAARNSTLHTCKVIFYRGKMKIKCKYAFFYLQPPDLNLNSSLFMT